MATIKLNENELITVSGVQFAVVKVYPVEQIADKTTRQYMAANGAIARAAVRKPRGQKIVNVVEIYSNGDMIAIRDLNQEQ